MRDASGPEQPSTGQDSAAGAKPSLPTSYVFRSSRYNPTKRMNGGILRVSYPDRPTLTKAQMSRHASGSTSLFDANPIDIPHGFVYFDSAKLKSEKSTDSIATLEDLGLEASKMDMTPGPPLKSNIAKYSRLSLGSNFTGIDRPEYDTSSDEPFRNERDSHSMTPGASVASANASAETDEVNAEP